MILLTETLRRSDDWDESTEASKNILASIYMIQNLIQSRAELECSKTRKRLEDKAMDEFMAQQLTYNK